MKKTKNKTKKVDNEISTPADVTFKISKQENIFNSIDELWGVKTTSKGYTCSNVEDYEKQLKSLSLNDLEKHAYEHDVSPGIPRDIMTEQLIKSFKIYLMGNKNKLKDIDPISTKLNKELIALTAIHN
jgi:hypothetical protein